MPCLGRAARAGLFLAISWIWPTSENNVSARGRLGVGREERQCSVGLPYLGTSEKSSAVNRFHGLLAKTYLGDIISPGERYVLGCVMSYVYDPVHWRNRARSMRAMAEQTNDINAKTMMLKLAEDYAARGDQAEAPAAPLGLTELPPLGVIGFRRSRARRDT